MSLTTIRNVGIILVLGALVAFVPSGGAGARIISYLLSTVFLALIAWVLGTLYRRYQSDIWGLGDRYRLVLYGAIAGAAVLLAAREKLADTGLGVLALVLGFVAVVIAVLRVLQHARGL